MNYQLTTLPGLSDVFKQELAEWLSEVKVTEVMRTRNNDIVLVRYAGDVKQLQKMRLMEDTYVTLGRVKLSGGLADMKTLSAAAVWSGPLREALNLWSRYTGQSLTKRQTFRVVVQADDVRWRQYRRQDMMLAAERALLRVGSSWRLDRDQAPLEVWLQQARRQLLVSVRLTTGLDRQHGGREVERAAALRPSVAAAMVWLSRPADDDVFLDPMCGSGTLLLERAVAGRYQLLLGGDIEAAAVETTLANFGPRHQPRRIERWDATDLPLEDGSVSKVVTNLPWGRQIGEKAVLPQLYAGFVAEAGRVLHPGGRLVVLTSEWDIFKGILARQAGFQIEQIVTNVEILGRRADIFVVNRA